MLRYDELLFNRFNEDWSQLPISKMLSFCWDRAVASTARNVL